MRQFSYSQVAAAILVLVFVTATSTLRGADAEPVTIEGLLARVPILSPKNERLSSFHIKVECTLPTPGKQPIGGDVAWSRDHGFGIVGLAGKNGAPQLFLAEEWMFLYEPTTATAIIDDETWPTIRLAAKPENKIGLVLGYTEHQSDAEMHIDLPSFFRPSEREVNLTQVDAQTWRLTQESPTGNSDLVADFQPAKAFPLTRLKVDFEDSFGGPLVISEITVNEPVPDRLNKFPRLEQFPKELKLRSGDTVDRPKNVEEFQAGLVFARFALDDPKLRQDKRLAHVDWEKAEQTDAAILPQLRDLFLEDITPSP